MKRLLIIIWIIFIMTFAQSCSGVGKHIQLSIESIRVEKNISSSRLDLFDGDINVGFYTIDSVIDDDKYVLQTKKDEYTLKLYVNPFYSFENIVVLNDNITQVKTKESFIELEEIHYIYQEYKINLKTMNAISIHGLKPINVLDYEWYVVFEHNDLGSSSNRHTYNFYFGKEIEDGDFDIDGIFGIDFIKKYRFMNYDIVRNTVTNEEDQDLRYTLNENNKIALDSVSWDVQNNLYNITHFWRLEPYNNYYKAKYPNDERTTYQILVRNEVYQYFLKDYYLETIKPKSWYDYNPQ